MYIVICASTVCRFIQMNRRWWLASPMVLHCKWAVLSVQISSEGSDFALSESKASQSLLNPFQAKPKKFPHFYRQNNASAHKQVSSKKIDPLRNYTTELLSNWNQKWTRKMMEKLDKNWFEINFDTKILLTIEFIWPRNTQKWPKNDQNVFNKMKWKIS